MSKRGLSAVFWLCLCSATVAVAAESGPQGNPPSRSRKPLEVLFLGDNGHHRPAERFLQIEPVLASRGIHLTYTDKPSDLEPQTLSRYAGLIVYANIERITPQQERALLDYVADGGGFIPIHCASYCFLNSPKYVELVGAQFQRHETGVFRTEIAEPDHPVMRGFAGFESWDETYVHHRHNQNRTVLEYRVEQGRREPWTWVRQHGRGRVFYTAWGHDERTWSHPGFHNLLERGIRWAVGDDPSVVPPYRDRPEMTRLAADLPAFRYREAEIPFYPAGRRWGTVGEPIRKMQLPLPAEASMQHMVTPVGFGVRLFASEPDIGKAIAMNWDERGRLWVCETVDYPNDKQPDWQGHDRIRICEDTDGDGRADKFTVFAEGLSIPTSLAFAYGGVIVHQPPHTLFLRDTDGDDVADERRILFTGWSTQDTHAGPSNLHYGFDNWYYGIVGYAGFQGEVGGERHSFSTGFYRFRVEQDDQGRVVATKMEFLRNTSNNSWGVGFNERGELFGSTANGNPSMHLPVPNRYYERVRGWSSQVLGSIAIDAEFDPITDKVRQVDFHGRFTAGAGHAIYTARTWPSEYWDRTAFVCGPTGHLVATFVLQPNGSSYISRNAWNLLASDDEWTAPIMAEVGPDGNVWVIDWYNYIVQHNPTPAGYRTGKGNAYISELRDKKHGRIYRIVYTGREDNGRFASQGDPSTGSSAVGGRPPYPPEALVGMLKSDNLLWRRHAQRLLVERGQLDVLPALIALVDDPSVDATGLNTGAIHALWTMHGLGALDGRHPDADRCVLRALKHPSSGVRQNALRVLPPIERSVAAVVESGVMTDPDARVRLAAMLALSDLPNSPQAAHAVLSALQQDRNLVDRWIVDAATSAGANNADEFLQLAAELERPGHHGPGGYTAEPHPALLGVVTRVAEHAARSIAAASAEPKRAAAASRRSANAGTAETGDEAGQSGAESRPVEKANTDGRWHKLLAALKRSHPAVAEALITGLERGWPAGRPIPLNADDEQALRVLADRLPADARSRLLRLAQRWGTQALDDYAAKLAAVFLARVQDENTATQARLAAARDLIRFRPDDGDTAAKLLALITPRMSSDLAVGLLEAVAQSEADRVGQVIAESLDSMTPAVRETAIRVLLRRKAWTEALLTAMEQGRLAPSVLRLEQRQALAAHPDRSIGARFRKLMQAGGGLPNPDRQKVLAQLLPVTESPGDAAAGKLVFKEHCSKCHTHSGEGAHIGPDLTGMAVHTKEELLRQIIDPSASVEGNFRAYTVVTSDGRVLTGLLSSENRNAVELFDTEGKKHVVLREDIEELIASNKSIMPEGFEKQLKPQQFADLLAFLTQRGRFLPLPLQKVATTVSTRGMFYNRDNLAETLTFRDWSPKTVAGVPFQLVDPQNGRTPNAILLYGPYGNIPPQMPKSVELPCRSKAKAIHMLSGVSGWGFPLGEKGSVSLIVRLHYADGVVEDHELKNGIHFADYIRRIDVPQSQFAFLLNGRQLRYLKIEPRRSEVIDRIEFIKGPDRTAPIVMAVTVETR